MLELDLHPALLNAGGIAALCSMEGSSAEPGSTPISKAPQQKSKLRRLISRSRSRKLHSREEGESLLLEGPMSSLSLDEVGASHGLMSFSLPAAIMLMQCLSAGSSERQC